MHQSNAKMYSEHWKATCQAVPCTLRQNVVLFLVNHPLEHDQAIFLIPPSRTAPPEVCQMQISSQICWHIAIPVSGLGDTTAFCMNGQNWYTPPDLLSCLLLDLNLPENFLRL